MNSTRILQLFAVSFVLLEACHDAEPTPDPRIGELGRVRFSGGGGCSNSTTIAVGATARLTLEPQGGTTLPPLRVESSTPSVIAASAGAANDQIVLKALQAGSARVKVLSNGLLYDALRFSAAFAASATIEAPTAVFARGTYALKISDYLGACGKDCPLLGGEFLAWNSEPVGSLALFRDHDRTVLFTAGAAGPARVWAQDPASGQRLVDHQITVAPTSSAGALSATAIVATPDKKVSDPLPVPLSMPRGSSFLIRLVADGGALGAVPIAGRDIAWTIGGTAGVVSLLPLTDDPPPEGPIFTADAAGQATLHADVALLGKSLDIAVTVAP